MTDIAAMILNAVFCLELVSYTIFDIDITFYDVFFIFIFLYQWRT